MYLLNLCKHETKYMKKLFTLLLAITVCTSLFASTDIRGGHDPLLKRFITDNKWKPNEAFQARHRQQNEWKAFINSNGSWWVQFNETNKKPHRAFGEPINLNFNSNPQAAAMYFLNNYASAYLPATVELRFKGAPVSKKYIQPNFVQYFNGMEVLFSRATVKMTTDYKVVMFGLDVYDDIKSLPLNKLSSEDAIFAATQNLNLAITNVIADPALKILPIPQGQKNNYHVVYSILVRTLSSERIPGAYETLVDANTGQILSRTNKIEFFGNTDVNVKSTVSTTHPYNASQIVNMPYVNVNVGGIDYTTNVNGDLNLTNTVPTTANVTLKGPWAEVFTGPGSSGTPTFVTNLSPGANTISFDATTTQRHTSAYYHTNIVHDFLNSHIPTYAGLDFPIDVHVERTDGTCNAFYDGGLNFYTTAGGCYALSLVNDVVYHEYGHGITNTYWANNGSSFDNGGMGEGYSDIWAISITNNPVLGIGFSDTDPTTYVRNYDFTNGVPRKVYPQNIAGQVHADGEIIAGAWWSTALNLGNVALMTPIFAESHAGLANGPNGAEGQVYTDILIDALMADDTDGNLNNGTPNIAEITGGFALHGITLLSNANLNHTPVATAQENTSITLNANLSNLQFAWALSGVKGAYKINNSATWTPVTFTNSGGNNYTASLPGQPNGTVISYYLGLEDINGILSNVQPAGADAVNPNIPYYIIIGYDKIFTEDFDITAGFWSEGAPGDNATTGVWEQNLPEQTTIGNNSVVQPDFQVTPGGQFCYVTGGAAGTGAGSFDVDGGKTTLISPTFDLSGYTNPIVEYYRWYSNDQGATPGTDYWQVAISNDQINYVDVENTNVADHSWRKFVFRINDYVQANSTVSVRFIAEDANAGSLIEALMDDFSVYDQLAVGLNEINELTSISAYPNPASDLLQLSCILGKGGNFNITLSNAIGQQVFNEAVDLNVGKQILEIPVQNLSSGIYNLTVSGVNQQKTIKINIFR